jgi:hypothetical protein
VLATPPGGKSLYLKTMNDEIRMTKEAQNPNNIITMGPRYASGLRQFFAVRISSFWI